MTRMDLLILLAGYTATEAWTRIGVEFWGGRDYYAFVVVVGAQYIDKMAGDDAAVLDGEIDLLPVGVITYEVQACVVAVGGAVHPYGRDLERMEAGHVREDRRGLQRAAVGIRGGADAARTSQASVLGTLPPRPSAQSSRPS